MGDCYYDKDQCGNCCVIARHFSFLRSQWRILTQLFYTRRGAEQRRPVAPVWPTRRLRAWRERGGPRRVSHPIHPRIRPPAVERAKGRGLSGLLGTVLIRRAGHLGGLMLGGNAAIRRKLVDSVRQFLTKTLQQLLSRHAGLAREPVDFFRAQRFLEFGRRDWLVRAAANP